MGKARQAAEGVIAAFERHNLQDAKRWLAPNFTFVGLENPEPASADDWLGGNQLMITAFPDINYNFEVIKEEGNQVWVRNNFEGTHTGEWDVSPIGMGTLPATGKSVSTPPSVTKGTVNDEGKVTRIEVVEMADGGGMMGVLTQLGVDVG